MKVVCCPRQDERPIEKVQYARNSVEGEGTVIAEIAAKTEREVRNGKIKEVADSGIREH